MGASMRRRVQIAAGTTLALWSVWAVAQNAPESLLPKSFDRPTQKASARPAPDKSAPDKPAPERTVPDKNGQVSIPVVQAVPGGTGSVAAAPMALPANLPSLKALEAMSPDELDALLGLKPKSDIPAAARRELKRVGIIDQNEGGMGEGAFTAQNPTLIRAALAGNNGLMVSRWGHVLLRRVLASRLDAPAGMNPADFTALRAQLLVRMGEGEAARALVQDVDGASYSPLLTQAAFDAYISTSDFTGMCPIVSLQSGSRKDPPWKVMQAICAGFTGQGSSSMAQLDRLTYYGAMPRIDMLLAQKYAGAAGKAKRAVKIEWDGVSTMTPWRYGLTLATGLMPPASLMKDADPRYTYTAATAPMLGLEARAAAADRAAGAGILSSAAMVDLYGQIYDNGDISGDWADRADALRDAYAAAEPADRLAAIKRLWGDPSDADQRYSRQVLTAYAAARLPVLSDFSVDAPDLISSMLAAGLDRNALRWVNLADAGSPAWALLALASPRVQAADSAIKKFHDKDASTGQRKSHFLLAGLAGMGRISPDSASSLAGSFGIDLARQTRWTRAIDASAQVDNAALVGLLAGLGMQGDSWAKMTPMYLYHIVGALHRVGMDGEAQMIAAEAVARG